MDTIIVGLAATGTTILAAPLVILAAAIRRQEHAASLRSRPAGPTAAFTRKVLALHATPLTGSQLNHAAAVRPRSLAGRVRP